MKDIIAEREIKGLDFFIFISLDDTLLGVVRINEQFGEKMSTVGTHRSVENHNRQTKKYAVNQIPNDVSFKELFVRIRVFF